LKQYFWNKYDGSKSGYLTEKQIKDSFKALDISMTQQQIEYLIMCLYEYTGNLKKLEYMRMFELFETEEHRRLKKIIESYQNYDIESEHSEKKVKFADKNSNIEEKGISFAILVNLLEYHQETDRASSSRNESHARKNLEDQFNEEENIEDIQAEGQEEEIDDDEEEEEEEEEDEEGLENGEEAVNRDC
jgi:hypothetical protein